MTVRSITAFARTERPAIASTLPAVDVDVPAFYRTGSRLRVQIPTQGSVHVLIGGFS